MESSTPSSSSSSLLLTSGATGRVNALLSLRALKSFVLLIKAFLLLVLVPFQVFLKRCIPLVLVVVIDHKSSSKDKDERQHHDSCSSSSSMVVTCTSSSYQPTNSSITKSSSSSSSSPIFRFPASLYPRRSNVVVIDPEVAARRALAIKRVSQDIGNHNTTCIREFSLFLNSRAETLFTQSWTPPLAAAHPSINIRGVVVLLHGLNEHCGRYNDFAKKLSANGFKVYGMDWIGHGGSDGLHAYVHFLDHPAKDLKTFVEKVLKENPGIPCFCFGHSTGGAIILKAILDPKIDLRVQGVVLTSPAVRVQLAHPIYGVLAPIVSFLLPKYQLSAANKNGTCVSRDPAALIAKYADPLVYTGSIRVRTGSEILRISSYLQQHLSRLTTPFLVLHGSDDAVTDPSASLELYERASSSDKSIKLYKGLLHDILFEPERELVAQDIIEWLNSRVKV